MSVLRADMSSFQCVCLECCLLDAIISLLKSLLSKQLSPSYIRRKSKLRVRKSTIRSTGSSLSEVKEGGDETGQDSLQEMSVIEKMVIEEIEGDDSDIDSVMESDESRVRFSSLW